jgi:hypothetical protein
LVDSLELYIQLIDSIRVKSHAQAHIDASSAMKTSQNSGMLLFMSLDAQKYALSIRLAAFTILFSPSTSPVLSLTSGRSMEISSSWSVGKSFQIDKGLATIIEVIYSEPIRWSVMRLVNWSRHAFIRLVQFSQQRARVECAVVLYFNQEKSAWYT